MIDFATLKGMEIPEGKVKSILITEADGTAYEVGFEPDVATIFLSFNRVGGGLFRDYASVTVDGVEYPLEEYDLTATALIVPLGAVITCKSNKTTLNGTTVASGYNEYQYTVVGDATISANISYSYNPMTGGSSSGDIAIKEVSEGYAVVAITGYSGISSECNVTVDGQKRFNTFLYVPFGTQVTCFVQRPDALSVGYIFLNGNEVSRDTSGSGVSYNYMVNGNILILLDSYGLSGDERNNIYITEL